ncbi:hypothetical protein [uncultured Tateyamaria sp.]|uniref:hypothetical protein n=1 Tax=uncultured Tateyamaria sp. TaxID=455651 RepID=UPI00262FAD60|nr:hypothetical protein [uncultured Tateyamaria sp.]
MTRLNRRQTFAMLGATALTACAPAIPLAQLGEDPFEGGIGGTGIVGLMTGTGSVLVNGLRVEMPDQVRVFFDGAQGSATRLVPGMGLSMVARTRLDRFEAVRIDVDTPLVGHLRRHGSGFAVNGTRVHLTTGASLVGRRVSVHGIWRPDGSVQSNLTHATQTTQDRVAGVLVGSATSGWSIGQTPLVTDAAARLTAGQFAVAQGTFDGTTLVTTSVQMGRFREGGGTLRQLSVEGFLEPIDSAPGFRVSGLGHSFDQRLALAPFATHRAVYFGPYDGRFRAQRAVVLPNSTAQRAALLTPTEGARTAAGLAGPTAQRVQRR